MCRIWRDKGAFGEVDVYWEIIDPISNTMPPENSEFEKSNGTVYFDEGVYQQTLRILPRSDSAPEKQRQYVVKLADVEGKSMDTSGSVRWKLSQWPHQALLALQNKDMFKIKLFCSLSCFF